MQLTYTIDQERGYEGMLADGKHIDADSAVLEGAPGALRAGDAVTHGTEDNTFKVLAAATDKIAGVLIYRPIVDGLVETGRAQTLLRKGRILVKPTTVVAPGDAVHVLASGKFANAGGTVVAGASWRTSTVAVGDLAVLDLNLPS